MSSPTKMYDADSAFSAWLTKPFCLETFKAAPEFRMALDNCSKEQGQAYLDRVQIEFPEISIEDISAFAELNDRLGDPQMCVFMSAHEKMLFLSPANLRYVYLALTILRDMRARECTSITEIGGGYGGLWLAISVFREKMGVSVDRYSIIELPGMVPLTQAFISATVAANPAEKWLTCGVFSAETGYAEVDVQYIVSAYCFTELTENEQLRYRDTLCSRAKHGFVLWQTAFGCRVARAESMLGHTVRRISLENPQTATDAKPNYMVFF